MLPQTAPKFNTVDLDPGQHRIVTTHLFGLTPADIRRARLVARLHELGPRPILELLTEVALEHHLGDDIEVRLERYGRLDPRTVALVGGRRLPKPSLLAVPR